MTDPASPAATPDDPAQDATVPSSPAPRSTRRRPPRKTTGAAPKPPAASTQEIDAGLVGWANAQENLEIVAVPRNIDVRGFQVLPRRWVVERTFGWLGRCRRLARDYERKASHVEAMIKVAMIRLMAGRLAGEDVEPHGSIETEAARRLTDDLNNKK